MAAHAPRSRFQAGQPSTPVARASCACHRPCQCAIALPMHKSAHECQRRSGQSIVTSVSTWTTDSLKPWLDRS